MSYFEGLERRIPSVEAERAMLAARAALYPHVTKEGAERMWAVWSRAADGPASVQSFASRVPATGFTLNGRAVSGDELFASLSGLLGRGVTA